MHLSIVISTEILLNTLHFNHILFLNLLKALKDTNVIASVS